MDIRKAFIDSFHHLNKHKFLVWPILALFLAPLFLGFIFLHVSGLYSPLVTVMQDARVFERLSDEEQLIYAQRGNYTPSFTNLNSFTRNIQQQEMRDAGLPVYMQDLGHLDISSYLSDRVSLKNILLLVFFVFLALLVSNYFYCSSYALLVASLRKKTAPLFFAATFQQFLGYLWLMILGGLIIFFLPFAGAGIIIFLITLLSFIPYISILIPLIIFAAILVIIWLLLRFYFALYIFFYNNVSAWSSIKKSYQITQGNLKKTFLLGLISFAIIMSSSLLPSPLEGGFKLLFIRDFLPLLFELILVIASTILTIFVYTFCSLFNLQAYRSFTEKHNRRRK